MDGRDEFMGEQVTVSKHSDPNIQGISGKIIDETRETITIFSDGKAKMVSSAQVNSCSKVVNLREIKLLIDHKTELKR